MTNDCQLSVSLELVMWVVHIFLNWSEELRVYLIQGVQLLKNVEGIIPRIGLEP